MKAGNNMGLIRLGNKPPLTVVPEDTIVQAARAMIERGVGAATVLEAGVVVGVVTERDIMRKVVAAEREPNVTRVRDIMTSPVLSVNLNTSVAEAAKIMREHHIRHLVVMDEHEKLAGMLALRYLLYDLMDDLERTVGDLMGHMMNDSPGG
jgi:CBS domain-containing protein